MVHNEAGMIPVVFAHRGNQEYLRTAIEQATRRNEVVLLGDETNKTVTDSCYWFDWDGLTERDKDFDKFRQHYVPMASGHGDFEFAWYHRWFALREWMKRTGKDVVFYCDSDVMLYCDVNEPVKSYPDGWRVALQIPHYQPDYRWSASGHVSYWTLDGLNGFCRFVVTMYGNEAGRAKLKEKWDWHQETGTPGGICDMTLLYLWTKLHTKQGVIVNNAEVWDSATFDHNINVAENAWPDEYRMTSDNPPIKQIQGILMRDGDYWYQGFNEALWYSDCEDNPYIKFNALHFQGGAKELMKEYRG